MKMIFLPTYSMDVKYNMVKYERNKNFYITLINQVLFELPLTTFVTQFLWKTLVVYRKILPKVFLKKYFIVRLTILNRSQVLFAEAAETYLIDPLIMLLWLHFYTNCLVNVFADYINHFADFLPPSDHKLYNNNNTNIL